MPFPHTENWDAPTAPALPSGWTNPSSFFQTSSGTFSGQFTAGPISHPNVVALPAGDGPAAITYGSIDTNSGNVAISGTVLFDVAFSTRSASVFWRCNTSTLVLGTSNYYEARLDAFNSQLVWYSQVGATSTAIVTVSSVSLSANSWYIIAPSSNGATTTISLQRVSDGKYWYSGAWNSAPGNAISGTNSAVTGAGYAGYIGDAGLSSDIIFDDWSFQSFGSLSLSAGTGTFVETGEPAVTTHQRVISVNPGAIAETGEPASLRWGRIGVVSPGSFSLTGESAGLFWNVATLAASAGQFLEAGIASHLLHGRVLPSSEGSFALTGKSSLLTTNIATLVTAAGSFTETGIAAKLLVSHKLPSTAGAFVLTGEPATLIPGPSPLLASAGVFLLAGENATLEHGRLFAASSGTFLVTGEPASMMPSDLLMASPGTFLVGRLSATMTHQYGLLASPGTFVVTGKSADLQQPFIMNASAGLFVVTGESAGLGAGHLLTAGEGSFVVDGQPAVLIFEGSPGNVQYHVYSNSGIGDPINYSSPIDTTGTLTYTTAPLSFPGVWIFAVRAFYVGSGLEEMNVDAAVKIILDTSGKDITNSPPAPIGLRAFATLASTIRVEWTEPPSTSAKTPTGFHIYLGTTGTPDYTTIVGTVLFNTSLAGSFVYNSSPLLSGTTYAVGVRAYNSTAEESNTSTVLVVPQGTGPTAVVGLTGIAIS